MNARDELNQRAGPTAHRELGAHRVGGGGIHVARVGRGQERPRRGGADLDLGAEHRRGRDGRGGHHLVGRLGDGRELELGQLGGGLVAVLVAADHGRGEAPSAIEGHHEHVAAGHPVHVRDARRHGRRRHELERI
jgi:hypothetical protein